MVTGPDDLKELLRRWGRPLTGRSPPHAFARRCRTRYGISARWVCQGGLGVSGAHAVTLGGSPRFLHARIAHPDTGAAVAINNNFLAVPQTQHVDAMCDTPSLRFAPTTCVGCTCVQVLEERAAAELVPKLRREMLEVINAR